MSTVIYHLTGKPAQMGLLLKLPYLALERHLALRLREVGFAEVRPAHFTVFQVLPREGARLTELADRATMTKQSMGYLVDYLEQHGYLQRVPDPADQRAQIIRATPKTMKLSDAVQRILDDLEQQWARRLGKPKLRQLKSLLGELAGVLEEPDPKLKTLVIG